MRVWKLWYIRFSSGRWCRYKLETNSLYAPLGTLFLSFIPSFNLPPLITAPCVSLFLFFLIFFRLNFPPPSTSRFFFCYFFGECLISLPVNWPQMGPAKLETFPPRQLIGLTPFQLPWKLTKPPPPRNSSPSDECHVWFTLAVSKQCSTTNWVLCLFLIALQTFPMLTPIFLTNKTWYANFLNDLKI